jgi:hypothetical protein
MANWWWPEHTLVVLLVYGLVHVFFNDILIKSFDLRAAKCKMFHVLPMFPNTCHPCPRSIQSLREVPVSNSIPGWNPGSGGE